VRRIEFESWIDDELRQIRDAVAEAL